MREIKFRVWFTDLNEMGHTGDGYTRVDFLEEDPSFYHGVHKWPYNPNGLEERFEWIESKQYILMQYTGLKDKNGLEIYEGDVVRLINMPGSIGADHMEGTGVVTFNQNDLQYQWGGYGILTWGRTESVEVMGNIYEHPHLLNTEK